jgi:hypothetical protein
MSRCEQGKNHRIFLINRESSIIIWYDEWMEPNFKSVRITLNCRVLVELVDTSGAVERREFTIVTGKLADFKSGLLDENTPLGIALQGHAAGETIPYRTGDLTEVRILAVAGGEDASSSEAAEERRAAVQKAAAQSEITNQMIFSTASGSKWGDYNVDMDKLLNDAEHDPQEEKPGKKKPKA